MSLIFKRISLLFCVAIFVFSATSCKKIIDDIRQNWAEDYFEDNIMERNFKITYAKKDSANITTLFDGYTFILYKNTFYDGPMVAIKDGITYNGTWACNEDYGKLTIQIAHPDPVNSGFNFINRSWRFKRKALPVLELAPWGNQLPHELHLLRY